MSAIENVAADLNITSLGQKGGVLLTDTTALTGNYRIIQVLADAVFSLLTSELTKNGVSVAAAAADFGTVVAGTILYGRFTAITLTSGKIIVYK